jgi:hypothetical protein
MAIEELSEQITEIGSTMEANKEDEIALLTPSGSYSMRALNILAAALNELLPMFNMPDYPMFEEGVEGPLPEEFVRQLAMVEAAAEGAGLESFPMDEAVDDRGLEMIAGRLHTLARDKTFAKFVADEATQIDLSRTEDEEITTTPDDLDVEEINVDELFMERMK